MPRQRHYPSPVGGGRGTRGRAQNEMTSRTTRSVLSFRTLVRRQSSERAIRIHRPSRLSGAERRSNATDPPKAPIRPSIGSRAMCTERLFTRESSPKRERLMNWISVVRGRLRGPLLADAVANRELRVSDGVGAARARGRGRRGRRRGGGPRADKQKHDFSLSSICPTRVPRAAFGGGGGGGEGLREEVGGRWRDKTGRR